MGISGSQKALMQCRSGLARSAASRSGYFICTVFVWMRTPAGAGVDVSAHVVHNGWQINLNLNDEVDTATLSLLPTLPFIPHPRTQIQIGFGSIATLQFAGLVMTVQRTRRPGPDSRFWYDVTCTDWTPVFDAHLVVADYPAQSATTTIADLVSRFTRGNFTTQGVSSSLPVVAELSVVNERPSTVLRRLTNKLGGGFYLDAFRRLRVWSSTIPSPIQDTDPQPLTDSLSTLKTFRGIEEGSQVRTRVWVEGRRTSMHLGLPSVFGAEPFNLPLTEGQMFPATPVTYQYDRIGTQLGSGPWDQHNPVLDAARNQPGTKVTADAAAGAIVVYVADASLFPVIGWVQIGGQVLHFNRGTSTTDLLIPPSPEFGSLQAPVTAGAQVTSLPWILHDSYDRTATSTALPLERQPARAQPADAPVVLVVMKQHESAAAQMATLEGSDGYHEHLVQDGRFSAAGAAARADAELLDFALPFMTYEWDTEDMNAAPGRMQSIRLPGVIDDVRITNVTITPVATNHPPRRHVRATKIRTAGVVDIWVDDAR